MEKKWTHKMLCISRLGCFEWICDKKINKRKDKTCTIGYFWMSVRLQSTINCRLSPEVIEWALSTQKALTLISLLFYCQILSTSWHLFRTKSVSPGWADQFITSQLTHPALPLSPPLSSHSSMIHHDNWIRRRLGGQAAGEQGDGEGDI